MDLAAEAPIPVLNNFPSFAGIGPFISVISRYETVDNNRTERKVAGCTLQ